MFTLFTPRLACNGYVTQGDDWAIFVGRGPAWTYGPGADKPDPDAVFYAAARAYATNMVPPDVGANQRIAYDTWAYTTRIPSADWSPDLHASPAPLANVMIYRYP